MRLIRIPLVVATTFATASKASALTFNFAILDGDTLTTDQAAAFTTAAAAWSSTFTDPFTVSLRIGFRSLQPGVLGETTSSLLAGSALTIAGQLAADAKSIDDVYAVSSLATATGTVVLTTAQAKAIGQTYAGTDGIIEFSSDYAFSTARDASGNIAPGTYDLVGVAEHEIGHILAFDSSLDDGLLSPTLLDEFRYASPGVRSFTAGAPAYFSIDGGTTGLGGFAVGGAGNDQASHWVRGTGALMDPAIAPGATQNITRLDARAFDVLGYDLATDVPEPATVALLLPFALAAIARRRATGV